MPHYCRICDRGRPNEKFTGRGHRDHICKDCQRLPRSEREQIESMDELFWFLEQSNISAKNIARLEILIHHTDSHVKRLAALVLDIAGVKPHKRRRWKFLAQNHPVLFARLKELYGGDMPYDVLETLNLEEDGSDLSDDLLDLHKFRIGLKFGKTGFAFLVARDLTITTTSAFMERFGSYFSRWDA
jgi:hypothetical protein